MTSTELRSKQGVILGSVTVEIPSPKFNLDDIVRLNFKYEPVDPSSQYPVPYFIESQGFSPQRIPICNFYRNNLTYELEFRAMESGNLRISAFFYCNNYPAGQIDINFEKQADGSYQTAMPDKADKHD